MRDPNRLPNVYAELAELHKKYFPDMRFAQFWLNALGWLYNKHGDPFFYEDDKIVGYAKEYCEANCPWCYSENVMPEATNE